MNAHGKLCVIQADALQFTEEYVPDALVLGDEVFLTNMKGQNGAETKTIRKTSLTRRM